ncbi:beta-phosphoglucomutase [Sapientia aquatica]|uniref:Beta-phosphoglucomutase n=1 Tax=Sapientia aquatica TaxID=1549640 RepID=A0A4R5VY47_9BURK|nr:beta-phosphoglucomutase [Sapientia aquatica]TDK64419.1 beta-phosphoglucomutase [Sapientia aquatica]
MKQQRYDAVIFDLDGVLTDTAHFHFLAWQQLAQSLGIDFDSAFNEQLKGVDRMGSLSRILDLSDKQFSHDDKLKLAELKNRHYQKLIAHMSPDDLLPGAIECLSSLRLAKIKLGLASVSKNALAVLESLEIRHYFDVVVDAALIKHSKPDPEIFLTAAKQLNVSASMCLGVEDSIAGISSIKSAGMTAIGIGSSSVLREADMTIPDLRTLLHYISLN